MDIDTLIAVVKDAETTFVLRPHPVLPDVRRVLEAVREDMGDDRLLCEKRKADAACSYLSDQPYSGPDLTCRDCPINHHAATRAALEQLK